MAVVARLGDQDSLQAARYRRQIGTAWLEQGHPGRALPHLEGALAQMATGVAPERALAEVRFALARALVANGGARERARMLAQAAREGFGQLGDHAAKRLAAVASWLAELGAH